MSTDFRLSTEVTAGDLFGGRNGIREHQAPDTNERKRCLTDGNNNFLGYASARMGWLLV
jgi:hypothetical protein